jgi:hypothetical protein
MTNAQARRQVKHIHAGKQRALHILCATLLFGAGWGSPAARAQGTPQLVSVAPANGDTNAALNSTLVFVFNQVMDTNVPVLPSFPPFLVGNLDVTPASTFVSGTWSADGRTLTCESLSPLPANTDVNWTLNPANSAFPLASSSGVPLMTVSGSFRTGSSSSGGCDQSGLPPGWGNYSINKSSFYQQTSAADPVPAAQSPFLFGAFVQSPSSGPAVTGGSVTLPDNSSDDLQGQGLGGSFFFSTNPPTEAALDSAYPAGSYTLRFTQTGQPERVIAMNMPALGAPVPKIDNFSATQSVDATQDFTLNWGAFTGAGANDYISLVVSDDLGGVVFQAPDLCVPRILLVTATSIVIPANTLNTNQTYTATLAFGRVFYFSTNAVPQMVGSGSISRNTRFTIDTASGGLPDPASLTDPRLLPSGNPEIDLTGTPTRAYSIERSGNLTNPNWTPVGSVTMDTTGKGIFQDIQPDKTFPLFYRAVAN